MANIEIYKNNALQTARKLSWNNRAKELITLFNNLT